eukprot:m.127437 g.127437  ORF g.127437 m.127437 type:complete len:190 (-) comp22231_c0_seq1:241-810(-)
MWALYILSWVSSLLLACFGIVCIASGLYFLAETVEEYSVATKQLLNFAVVACTFCNLLVGLVEPIPIWVTVVAVVAHGAYLNTLQTFPVLETGPSFYASCLLILLHNYLAFTTFADTWFPFDEVCVACSVQLFSSSPRILCESLNPSTHLALDLLAPLASPCRTLFARTRHSCNRIDRPIAVAHSDCSF